MRSEDQEKLRLHEDERGLGLPRPGSLEPVPGPPVPYPERGRSPVVTIKTIENAWVVVTNEYSADARTWSYRTPAAVARAVKSLLIGEEPPKS